MTEQMKPPTRKRPTGRVLGGGRAATAPPPPPTTAELTREQLAAEEGGRAAATPASDVPSAPASPEHEPHAPAEPAPSPVAPITTPPQAPASPTTAPAVVSQESSLPAQVNSSTVAPAAEERLPNGAVGSGTGETETEGEAWVRGPGRPEDIREARVILNERRITRESLDASVPKELRLKKRFARFRLDNDLDDLPPADVYAVALDLFLTERGY